VRVIIRGLGELCITAGLIVLLFVTYELWGTGRYTQQQQDRLGRDLLKSWQSTRVTHERVRLGSGLAVIRIPRFGADHRFVVVEGVEQDDLRKGPGHYPGSALPGQVGNFVVSAHRTTYSAPFNRVGELRAGDRIIVDTRAKQYVYQVTGRRIVDPDTVAVTLPVPFRPQARPTEKLITLTTCHPKYSARQRMIVFGRLVSELPRVATPATATGR
jgi:sortase A